MLIDNIYFLIQQTMIFVVPLLIVALGGMFSEKSGVINIALEGIMIIGAFTGIVFINAVQKVGFLDDKPQLLLLLALLISAGCGIIFSSLLAFASVNMKADQTIGGTALNLLAPALVIFIARTTTNVKQVYFNPVFLIREIPILSKFPLFGSGTVLLFDKNIISQLPNIGSAFFTNAYFTTFLGLVILFVSVIFLYKTRLGMRLSACGEHPQAAESVGVNVYKMRWTGVLLSGALAGIGGLIYVVPTSVSFSGDVSGYGFLALAVMIFGQWRPKRILLAALFFGLFKTFSVTYTIFIDVSQNNSETLSYIFKMIPFIVTMVALAFTSKKSRAPKSEGIPYDSGAR